MYNNNFYPQPFGGNQYYGMQPTQQQPVTLSNPLTKEQLELLKKRTDKLSLVVTPLEVAKAICTHKQGNSICLYNEDPANPERVTCSICGETFDLTNGDQAAVEGAVELITNIIQTIKTYWLDVPDDVARELFTILPLIQRLPKVYALATKNFNSVQDMHRMSEVNQPYGFGMLGNIMNPMVGMGYGAYGYPQQGMVQQNPYYGQPAFPNPIGYPQQGFVPQPNGYAMNPVMMPQQPVQAPMYDPAAAGVNPFGYNVPTAPQQTPYNVQPQQPVAPVAQPAPAPQAAPTAHPPLNAQGVPAPAADAVNEKMFNV